MLSEGVNYVVSFSGGRTSAYMVWLIESLRKGTDIKVEYVFQDTGAEHPKTYEFIHNVVKEFGIRLTCIKAKIDQTMGVGVNYEEISIESIGYNLQIWREMMSKYGAPSITGPKCTEKLKTIPFKKYCDSKYGKGNYELFLGIREDERRRIKSDLSINYLADISNFDKQDVLDFWSKQPFDLEIPEYLGNCVFCIKKSHKKVALAVKEEPKLAIQFIDVVNEPTVRVMNGMDPTKMYRNYYSLSDIAMNYELISEEDLRENIVRSRELDSNSCSESCEFISEETLDVFKNS